MRPPAQPSRSHRRGGPPGRRERPHRLPRGILPLLGPAIATVVIAKGVNVHDDSHIPFLHVPSEDLGAISTSPFRFEGPFGTH